MARRHNNRGGQYRHDPARKDRSQNRLLVASVGDSPTVTNGHNGHATSIALADATAPIVVPMTNKRNPGSSPFVSAAAFSALDNGDKPYPRMEPNSPDHPPLEAAGAAGNQIFAGIIAQDAEYNADFYWRDAIDVYEKMRRNDAQINAVLNMLYLPIQRTTWRIKPASTSPIDKEIASFVESCLFHDMLYESTEGRTVRQQWMSILEHILLMLPFGFSVFSKWFRVDDDGWVKWARFEPLLQRTLWRWWVGSDSQLVGIQQRTFKNWRVEFEDIHADRILRFAWRQEGNNYDGWSVLRSAYKHWYYKDGFYKIQAIAVERSATMPPIGTLGPNDLNQASANALLTQLQNMRVSDSMGIVLPFGQQIQIPENHMRGSQEIDQAIAHHDMMIARNVLAQFINLGSTETGAYALADVQTKTFMECEEGVANYISSVLNTDAIPELVDYNYDGVSIYPEIEFEPLADADVKDVSLAIQNMASFISNDPGFEDYVRKLVGAPSAPKDVVVATNPTAPDKNAKQPGSAAQETKPAKPGVPENPADEAGDGKAAAASATAAGLREISMDFEYTIALMEADLAEAYDEYAEFLSEIQDEEDDAWLLSNDYPTQKGGRFGFGPGEPHAGSTPGQVRRSMQHEAGIAKAEKDLEARKAAYAQHLAAHPGAALTAEEKAQARTGGTAASGSSRRGNTQRVSDILGRSLVPINQIPGREITIQGLDPYEIQHVFGSHQLRQALGQMSAATLRGHVDTVMARNPGTRSTSRVSKAAMIDYITGQVAPGFSEPGSNAYMLAESGEPSPVDTRLLNEALAAIYGRDATERGMQHVERLALAERRVAAVKMCDCSPETPAIECVCDAECACRADGGSCPQMRGAQ